MLHYLAMIQRSFSIFLYFFLKNLYAFSFKCITKFLPQVEPSLFLNFHPTPKLSVKVLINQIVNF